MKRLFALGIAVSPSALPMREEQVAIAHSILSPKASTYQVLRFTLHRPYQAAAPHLELLDSFRVSVVPEAQACATGDCDGNETKPACAPGCPPNNCYCPGCSMTPTCTVYMCTQTGANRSCMTAFNKSPGCTECEDDINVHCNPHGGCGHNCLDKDKA